MVKNPPAMQETQVRSLGWEDPLEKGLTTCSSVLAWRIPWTEEPGGLPDMGCKRLVRDFATKQQDFTHVREVKELPLCQNCRCHFHCIR